MDLGIAGKVAVVTGSSQGLGKGVAKELAREGARVILVARTADKVGQVAAGFRAEGLDAVGLAADLTDKPSVARLFADVRQSHGGADILVYNNGGTRDAYFEEATDDDFVHAYQTLVMGFVWCVREVLPAMTARRWGRIVTLGSLCVKEPHKEYPLVLANLGRPAQVGLSKTLANELGAHGITVNTIATGTMDSDGESVRRAYAGKSASGRPPSDVENFRLGNVPAGRAGQPEELGALCSFLCSERAGYINGQTIVIDGGRVASLM